jgi:asparagine synthase (glutamine-hydrolysing)
MLTSAGECEEAVRECLDDTVRIMNRSDVPLGSVLSGGIDSSSVVASLAPRHPDLDTFCVSYRGDSVESEFPAAKMVADRYSTRHHEIVFGADKLAALPDVVRHYAEPFASFVPLHAQALAAETKKHVTVVLTGSGGDELFGNYDEHVTLFRRDRRLRRRAWLAKIGGWLSRPFAGSGEATRRRWLRDERGAWWAARLRLDGMKTFWDGCYADAMRKTAAEHDPARLYVETFRRYGAPWLFDNFVYQQIMLGSLHSLVDIPDISGMANALEYRAPFLDVRMMELAMRIPARFKVKPRLGPAGGKWVVRMSQKERLPPEIVAKPKSGFGEPIPYRRWMVGEWENDMRRLLGSKRLEEAGLFRTDRLLGCLDDARRGANVPMDLLWGAAVASQWLDEHC